MPKSQRQQHKAPYLGRIKLKWCFKCNVPILESKICPKCGSNTTHMNITPPGDVKPAFDKEMEHIRNIINENYGDNIGDLLFPRNKIYLINKIPGLDLTEEIITDGRTYGTYYFDPIKQKFDFKPKRPAAILMLRLAKDYKLELKRRFEISDDSVPYLLKGMSLLAPGIVSFSPNIKKGDHCIVSNNNKLVTIAISHLDANEIHKLIEIKHGSVGKNLKKNIEEEDSGDPTKSKDEEIFSMFNKTEFQNWNTIYEINTNHMLSIISEARTFIIKQKQKNEGREITVAYSGGKDSQCVLLLVYEALGPNFSIFFADTGLELPEVIENTKKIAKILNMEDKLIVKHAGDKFWELIEDFGPPSRDFRFCCHTLKAQQAMNIIEHISHGDKVLAFLGQRRYESFNRSAESRVYINSFIPLQIAATPIRDWCALEVWLFLLYYPHLINGKRTEIPVTSLYFEGHDRLGCYLCPASSLASLQMTRKSHPNLMQKWDTWLENYNKRFGYPIEWIRFGLWRYKNVNLQWVPILKELGIKYDLHQINKNQPLDVKITQGFSPCGQGGFSIKGKVNSILDIELINKIISIIPGEIELFEDLGVITIKNPEYLVNINADGTFYLQMWDPNYHYKKLLNDTIGIIVKSHRCTNCGVCAKICPVQIIRIVQNEEDILYYPEITPQQSQSCTHCKNCISHCPVYQKIKDTYN